MSSQDISQIFDLLVSFDLTKQIISHIYTVCKWRDAKKALTLLVPGVDSSRVPGFFREFVFL
jgi:hypothetical protein